MRLTSSAAGGCNWGEVPRDYTDPVAADWPHLLRIVEERVKPERMKVNRKIRRDRWWQYGDRQPALYAAIVGLERVLAISRLGQQGAFAFLSGRAVFADRLVVFPFDRYSHFCVLQSRPHDLWARFFGSTMKDDLLYTPSDCFGTFPFPDGWETESALEGVGNEYYEFRASLMVRNDEGLTKTYNRFHDPYENDPQIATLRELHAAMDPRRPRRLRLDGHPHRLRVPTRLRDRRGGMGHPQEALPLPLARRRPRRSPRPPARTQRPTVLGGSASLNEGDDTSPRRDSTAY